MNLGPSQAPPLGSRVNGPTVQSMMEEQQAILAECLSVADQIDAALNGPKPVGTEQVEKAPPSMTQRLLSHTQRLALLREKLLAIGQQL